MQEPSALVNRGPELVLRHCWGVARWTGHLRVVSRRSFVLLRLQLADRQHRWTGRLGTYLNYSTVR